MALNRISNRKHLLLAIISLLAVSFSLKAQVPDFTPSVTQGCSPLAVNFVNNSTGAGPGALYSWTFGNGNGITTTFKNTSPSATYFVGQVYTVTLTITDGAKPPVSISKLITVFKKPAITITADKTVGCTPLPVNFTSTVNPGDGSITGALWTFGDGSTQSTISNTVSHTYIAPSPGTGYNISLTATNTYGCINTYQVANMIAVYPALVPSFNVDSAALCSLNQAAVFHNTSTGDGALSYLWTFGDGDSSNIASPSHLYSSKGNYSVGLTMYSTYGCTASVSKPALINASNHTMDFTATPPLCSGNSVLFVNKSNPAPSTTPLWSFGDGGSGIGFTYGHSFSAGGTYQVTMYANFGSCLDSVTKPVVVLGSPNISQFVITKDAACSSPMKVNFLDTSAGATNWHWNFTGNPADTSDLKNPTFTYTTNNLFSPTLTITNANGCSSTISQTFNTAQPTAKIVKDTTLIADATYCADVQATFKAVSVDTLATYFWSFGDGTTSTQASPQHTFTKPGTYIINLSFTTIHGCSGGAYPPDTVIVYPKPHAIFDAYDSTPCKNNQLETFINQDDSAARFQWFYGDGSSDYNNNVLHTHLYADSGLYTMTLIASSPGCAPDTYTIQRYVKTTPIPKLTVVNNCDIDRLSAALTVVPPGGLQYIWTYGDGSPDDSDNVYVPTKNHHYPKGGVYNAVVKVLYGTCWQTAGPVPVYVLAKQKPVLSSTKDTICASSTLPIKINGLDTNYQRYKTGSNTYYNIVKWQYNDGTLFNGSGNIKTSYSGTVGNLVAGHDSIRVIIQSGYFGCYDTSNFIPIHITGPVANFSDQNQLCYRSPIIFTDSSKPVNNVPIVSWNWNFADGNSVTRTTPDTVQHLYAFPGTYNPILTVTDSNGCKAAIKLPVTQVLIYGAKANFTWKPTAITPGFPIHFYNTTIKNTGVTYLWKFVGDGTTSTSPDSVVHIFPNVGTDTVILIATPTMPGACVDTLVMPLKILNIAAPFVDTSYYYHNSGCPPLIVDFTSFPVNTTGLHWDFGDGRTLDNVISPKGILYDTPGVYIVSLTGYGANNISVISYDTIYVKGPFGKLYSTLDKACAPALNTLHATSSFVGTFTWDFGDGTLMTTQDTTADHTYVLPGLFTPALILVDSNGCSMSYKLDHQILIDTMFVQLGPPILLCDTGIVLYGPHVVNWALDSLGYPVTFHWDFGTGSPQDTSNLQNPSFNYNKPGEYLTTLQATSFIGCTSSATDSVKVIGPFLMPVSPDTTICIGGYANLWADSAFTYLWSPANTLNKNTGDSVIARPASTTTYQVIGEDQYKCYFDTATTTVFVDSMPVITIPKEFAVLPGTDLVLEPQGSADIVTWNWTPPDYLNCTDCQSPITTPLKPIIYQVTGTTAKGCSSTVSVTVKLLCMENAVHMPNAFTPNFDGNNDYFYPYGFGVKIVRSFQVFSRWGQLLYERKEFPPNDKQYGWDGNLYGMPQPSGTYVYVVNMECFTGESFILKGTVELLR